MLQLHLLVLSYTEDFVELIHSQEMQEILLAPLIPMNLASKQKSTNSLDQYSVFKTFIRKQCPDTKIEVSGVYQLFWCRLAIMMTAQEFPHAAKMQRSVGYFYKLCLFH